MAKNGAKDPVERARRKVAKAQSRYMKAVARAERQIRNVRALADEQIAEAKAKFELRAGELAEAEQSHGIRDVPSPGLMAVDVLELPAAKPAPAADSNGNTAKSRAKPASPRPKSVRATESPKSASSKRPK